MYIQLLLIFYVINENFAIFPSLWNDESKKYGEIFANLEITDMRDGVRNFVSKVLFREPLSSCICLITDKIYYHEIYSDTLIKSLDGRLIYLLSIGDAEKYDDDTDERKLHVLMAMKARNCDFMSCS